MKLSDIINRYEAMAVDACLSPAVSTIVKDIDHTPDKINQAKTKAQRQWFGAIATLEEILLSQVNETKTDDTTCRGLILSAPTTILCHQSLNCQFQTGVFTPQTGKKLTSMRSQLPAARETESHTIETVAELPLFPKDPIATEQFCLVLTPYFGLIAVLGEDSQRLPAFQFSFEPEVINQGWLALRSRLVAINYPKLSQFDALVRHFSPPIPDYRLVTQFSRLLLYYLPEVPAVHSAQHRLIHWESQNREKSSLELFNNAPDVAILQALTHEIRTPLTTIHTMTRLLLRNRGLTPQIIKLLEGIDQECTEQINRMELIFRATELKITSKKQNSVKLVYTSLENVLNESIPRWKKQAQRRNVILDIVVPQKLPQVVSDPAILNQVLMGLIEKFTRSFSEGGNIRVQVTTAGHQLKLQFRTESSCPHNPLKALGQLLMFHPNTGGLSLNLDVTKHLFHVLGGKLIVRQRSQYKQVFTIFLPLGQDSSNHDLNPLYQQKIR
ncbi:sensor histidine kinase [cyanobacterium endosymbiont of Epithemia clementina EcSB]|uniref:sensor histidine kinase n=1 Tax=cyanobacterium endosymbiont of Epithemia clementina EcSB TaxID=3034674 RepID=UPI0024811B13|nr:HAMP domain-containing sensor histidine kinase [cyanobacterium endosymbiont of Epithemia clementina EcSB]WGT67815.1 HAMP domain-containing sensor histidine kinase [cyanobacterium endosymbiont of Epithemia clementina EcSB]